MDTLPPTADPANRRRPVSFTVRSDLMDQARALKLNTSRAAEHGIEVAVKNAMGKAWLAENANAIKAYNARIESTGTLLKPIWLRR